MLRRRQLMAYGLGSLAASGLAGSGRAELPGGSGDLRFEVRRNGSEIGYHVLSFRQDGERLTVDIDIELRVRLAFVTLYR